MKEQFDDTIGQTIVVSIRPNDILELSHDAKELVFNPAAESAIIQLLSIQKQVDEAIKLVKDEIIRQGLDYSASFTAIVSPGLKANYSAAGAKYVEDTEVEIEQRRAPYWKREVKYSIDSKMVEKFEQRHHGHLPNGMRKAARNKNLSFKIRDEVQS